MTIETKFNLGDTVYLIRCGRTHTPTPCPDCEGVGELLLATGKTVPCIKCNRRGTVGRTLGDPKWITAGHLTLGKVSVEIVRETPPGERESEFENFGPQTASRKEAYMAYDTGIGTGINWQAEELFATEAEAAAECERRNAKAEAPDAES